MLPCTDCKDAECFECRQTILKYAIGGVLVLLLAIALWSRYGK